MEKITNLTTMVQFVLKQAKSPIHRVDIAFNCIQYAKFLDQTLNKNMFFPIKNGPILEGAPLSPAKDWEWLKWEEEREDFEKAMKSVLFKHSLSEIKVDSILLKNNCIEDLLKDWGFKLTETAIKKIFGDA